MKLAGALCFQAASAMREDVLQDDFGMLSMTAMISLQEQSTSKYLLEAASGRNATQMLSMIQSLAKESLDGDGVEALDEDIKKALYVIRGNLVTSIRDVLTNEHRADQDYIMEQLKCFTHCEHDLQDTEKECTDHSERAAALESAHASCRGSLMGKYVKKVSECNRLDDWVAAFRLTPKPVEECVYDGQFKCHVEECTDSDGGRCKPGVKQSFGAWLEKIIEETETGYKIWSRLQSSCRASYHAYIALDASCDVKQGEFEVQMCAGRQCRFQGCALQYTNCRDRCLEDYHRTVKRVECAEKDRKIDWSATEKIECYLRIILASPTDEDLQKNCQDQTKCLNEWRTREYNKCSDVCKLVDFDSGSYSQHDRRSDVSAQPLDPDQQLHSSQQGDRQHADNDVRGDVTSGVNTTHRGDGEHRCTQHLDIDFQPHPCARPCPPEPPMPCDQTFVDKYYAQFLAMTQIEQLGGDRQCHTDAPGEHTEKWAYNLCDCRPCSPCEGHVEEPEIIDQGCHDPECAFPFTYGDRTYNSCTDANHDGLWCSTVTVDGAHVPGQWKDCDCEGPAEGLIEEGATKPERYWSTAPEHAHLADDGKCRNHGCAFPFKYEGELYDSCTSVNHDEPWCATETDHGEYNGNWKNCRDCTEAATCVGSPPLTCRDYYGDVSGLVTVVDTALGVPGQTDPSGQYCDMYGLPRPCNFIHYAGLSTSCGNPGPMDGAHRYHKVTYTDDCKDVLAKLELTWTLDVTQAFDSQGVLKQCADFVLSNEESCWAPPRDHPQQVPCPETVTPALDCPSLNGFEQLCPENQEWAGVGTCPVLVTTAGSTCKNFCESQGVKCIKAMDNTGNECLLYPEGHARQTQEEDGCLQHWYNQVCVCGN